MLKIHICSKYLSVLKRFMDVFNEKSNMFVQSLNEKADGKTEILLFDKFNEISCDIIAKVIIYIL